MRPGTRNSLLGWTQAHKMFSYERKSKSLLRRSTVATGKKSALQGKLPTETEKTNSLSLRCEHALEFRERGWLTRTKTQHGITGAEISFEAINPKFGPSNPDPKRLPAWPGPSPTAQLWKLKLLLVAIAARESHAAQHFVSCKHTLRLKAV